MKVALACLILLGVAVAPAAGKPAGQVRGLLIGVDAYRILPRLKGAAADARDLEASLQAVGARDVRVVTDAGATRRLILTALQDLVRRSQASDTVFLAFSGYGARHFAGPTGLESDGMDQVLLLPNYDPKHHLQNVERLVDKELYHYAVQLENKGAHVVLIMDACFGEGVAREVDPRGPPLLYRCLSNTAAADDPQPVPTGAEATASLANLRLTMVLAASDKQSKAPEVQIPGKGPRGALSYAVARGLQGAADLDRDGTITGTELCEYARRVTYQLSDQRQRIVAAPSRAAPAEAVVSGVAARSSRGEASPRSDFGETLGASTRTQADAVLVASLDGVAERFAGLSVQAPFRVVEPSAHPDLAWDPATGDALSGGDVIVRAIDRNDLPILIERAALLRWLKQRAPASPLGVRISPDDQLHREGSGVEVEIGELANEALVVFNVAGDGTIELLYPMGSDPPIASGRQHRLKLRVRAPFGADQIVAVSSPRRMPELEQALRRLDRKRSPLNAREAVAKSIAADSRIGSAGLFTAP